jgi:hypothetical protein
MTEDASFLSLPVDAQASILAFLPHRDLARFSTVSRGCSNVATMDRLWSPLLARCFGDVVLPPSLSNRLHLWVGEFAALNRWPYVWSNRIPCLFVVILACATGWLAFLASMLLLFIITTLALFLLLEYLDQQKFPPLLMSRSPASKFGALASSYCAVCHKFLLSTQPKAEVGLTRYRGPHACDLCKYDMFSYLCAGCHCQRHCLRAACIYAKPSKSSDFECCQSCKGWAHYDCDQMSYCSECDRGFCPVCARSIFFDINAYTPHLPRAACAECRRSLFGHEDPEDY